MSSKSNAPRLVLISAAFIAAVGAAVFSYLALTDGYDIAIQHFAVGSPFPTIAACLCAAGILLGLAASFTALGRKFAVPEQPGALTVFAASMTGFMLLASFILSMRNLESFSALQIVLLSLMAISSAFFFLVTSNKTARGSGFAFLSLIPIVYAVAAVLAVYFDKKYGMNSPVKLYDLMMYLSMALFFTSEARVALGRVNSVTYIFFGTCCAVMATAVGGSHFAIALYDTVGHGFSLAESAAHLAIGLFAATRLISFRPIPAAEEIQEDPTHEIAETESPHEN